MYFDIVLFCNNQLPVRKYYTYFSDASDGKQFAACTLSGLRNNFNVEIHDECVIIHDVYAVGVNDLCTSMSMSHNIILRIHSADDDDSAFLMNRLF